MRAQAIVMPLPARSGGTLFGKTIETVLGERPLPRDPAGRARERRGRAAPA